MQRRKVNPKPKENKKKEAEEKSESFTFKSKSSPSNTYLRSLEETTYLIEAGSEVKRLCSGATASLASWATGSASSPSSDTSGGSSSSLETIGVRRRSFSPVSAPLCNCVGQWGAASSQTNDGRCEQEQRRRIHQKHPHCI